MNGDTINEIKDLLSEKGAITTQTALRLSLSLQAQIYEHVRSRDEEIESLKGRVKVVEDNSIILWMQKNPKLTLLIVTIYLILSALVDWSDVLAKAIGLKL